MQNPMGKARRRQRGVCEKVPGSGVWWVRHYDADGRLRRERVGCKSAALKVWVDEDGRNAKESEVARDRQGWVAPELLIITTCADCET
jgi:hypothetical protein